MNASLILAEGRYSVVQVMTYLGVIVVLAILLGLISVVLRRRLMNQTDDQPPLGFTLKDLRGLHAAGQLSDEELAAAEAKALARSRAHYLGQQPDDKPVQNAREQPGFTPPKLTPPDDDETGPDKNT